MPSAAPAIWPIIFNPRAHTSGIGPGIAGNHNPLFAMGATQLRLVVVGSHPSIERLY